MSPFSGFRFFASSVDVIAPKWIAPRMLAGLLCLGTASSAHAYRTAADLPDFPPRAVVRWKDDTIQLELYRGGAPGFSFEATQATVERALRTWSSPACSAVVFAPTETSSVHAAPGDGHNTVEWVGSGWAARGFDPDLPAFTDVQYERGSTTASIVEADVYLNADHRAWHLQADTSPRDGGSSAVDVLGVMTHEAGHVLGLLHPCEVDSGTDPTAPSCASDPNFRHTAMYPLYSPAEQHLSGDDVNGACFLYPAVAPDPVKGQPASSACDSGASSEGALGPRASLAPSDDSDGGMAGPLQHASGLQPLEQGGTATTPTCPPSPSCDSDAGSCAGKAAFGESCSSPAACESLECLSGVTGDPVCTRICNQHTLCPAGWNCLEVDKRSVCVPTHHACSVEPRLKGQAPALATFLWLTLVCSFAMNRRRRRSQGSNYPRNTPCKKQIARRT